VFLANWIYLMDQKTPNKDPIQAPVDRARRFFFVSRMVGFCMLASLGVVLAAGMGYLGAAPNLAQMYVQSLVATGTALSLAYIGGSVIDYNGGIGGLVRGLVKNRDQG